MRRKKPLELNELAEIEVVNAVEYYEGERAGLGDRFQTALLTTFDQIVAFPGRFGRVMVTRAGRSVRRAIVRPFSYKVVYVELPKELRVVAVAHLSRDPNYWKPRLGE